MPRQPDDNLHPVLDLLWESETGRTLNNELLAALRREVPSTRGSSEILALVGKIIVEQHILSHQRGAADQLVREMTT